MNLFRNNQVHKSSQNHKLLQLLNQHIVSTIVMFNGAQLGYVKGRGDSRGECEEFVDNYTIRVEHRFYDFDVQTEEKLHLFAMLLNRIVL